MRNYLHAKIKDVDDVEFQQLIDDLYHCIGWHRTTSPFDSLFDLITCIYMENKSCLKKSYLPSDDCLLLRPVDQLGDGVVLDVVKEISALKHKHIESYDGKTLLKVLKSLPDKDLGKQQPENKSESQMVYEHDQMLIKMRRENNSHNLWG